MIITYGIREVELSPLSDSDKKILLAGGWNPPAINTRFLSESGLSTDGVAWVVQMVYEKGFEAGVEYFQEQ